MQTGLLLCLFNMGTLRIDTGKLWYRDTLIGCLQSQVLVSYRDTVLSAIGNRFLHLDLSLSSSAISINSRLKHSTADVEMSCKPSIFPVCQSSKVQDISGFFMKTILVLPLILQPGMTTDHD